MNSEIQSEILSPLAGGAASYMQQTKPKAEWVCSYDGEAL